MTTRFGLSGGVLGVVAGLCAGVAGVVGWYSLGPVSPPEPPQSPVASAPQSGGSPGLGQAPEATGAAITAPASSASSVAATATVDAPNAVAQDAAALAGSTPPPLEQAAAVPAAEVPSFDTFRLGLDGSAVLAGLARGATDVRILLDGAEAARSTPDRGGRFAALFDIGLSSSARVLSLRAIGADGQEVASVETILIAPHQPAAPGLAQSPEAVGTEAVGEQRAVDVLHSPDIQQASAEGPQAATEAAASAGGAAALQPAVAGQVPQTAEVLVASAEPTAEAPVGERSADASAPATLLIGDGTIRRMDAAPATSGLAIDAISYDAQGAVQVAGRGAPGQALRVYLNNSPKLEAVIDATGRWQGELADVLPGLYTLRADQMDAAGKVTQRSETPFLREAPEALATVGAKDDPATPPTVELVTVQPGYTLWGIAKSSYGEGTRYVQVFEANRSQIRNPDLIYPGQVFSLPTLD